MEKVHHIDGKRIVETTYDPSDTIERNAELRATGPVYFGSKNQRLELAASIPMEHVTALRNMGYDLLSPDPDERRRALVYIQQNQQVFMTTDKQMFARTRAKWQ